MGSLWEVTQGGRSSFASGATTDEVTYPLEFDTSLSVLAIDVVASGTPAIIARKAGTNASVEFVTTSGSVAAYAWVAVGV